MYLKDFQNSRRDLRASVFFGSENEFSKSGIDREGGHLLTHFS